MQQIVIEGKKRADRGKNAMRRLRQSGTVPGVLYGGKGEPLPVALEARQLAPLFRTEAGHNALLSVKIEGLHEELAVLKDWQVDPLYGSLLHVDLLRIAKDVRMRIRVPVHTSGDPLGVKQQGGVFEVVSREVEIECLPMDIPDEFRVDVSSLMIGKQLRFSDLPLDPAKMKLVSEARTVIAHVVAPKKEEEVAATEVVAGAAPAEPEVIKKGKKEEEGEEGAAPAEKAEKAPKPEKSEKQEKKK
ncbi:MAG TPA: 50S ribosomal protein L25 [Candidatus Acidoferrales bacterium]|nr:50S ribosomal protein L25 [Candidatus Acidoferrales bacterium]